MTGRVDSVIVSLPSGRKLREMPRPIDALSPKRASPCLCAAQQNTRVRHDHFVNKIRRVFWHVSVDSVRLLPSILLFQLMKRKSLLK